MEIPREKAERLKRYFTNADPFLWGVLAAKNKKKRLEELKGMGFLATYAPGGNPIYTRINRDLLVELGIEGILSKIVVPRVQEGFRPEVLRYFRDCWEQGITPGVDYLVKNELYRKYTLTSVRSAEVYEGWGADTHVAGYRYPAYIFVHIERQYNVIEGWTVFAGLWFEEIEPLLR
jgi:hypothetical protein